ncbi:ABC transporter substrate-binding protein [Peptostreptococcaceae bacterium AGR-M142]
MKKTIINIFGVLFLTILLTSCSKKDIKIGFSATLTGSYSELGVAERNAVLIAVDEINRNGGIDGRKIDLVIRDDKGSNEGAKEAIEEFKALGIDIIIAFGTSNRADVVKEAIAKDKLLFISPTITTTKMTGIDDNFIRIISDLKRQSEVLGEMVYEDLKISEVGVIYDGKNKGFSDLVFENFKEYYSNVGGKIIFEYTITEDVPRLELIRELLLKSDAKGVVVVANSVDSASITQEIRKHDKDIKIFMSNWGMTGDFIGHSGKAAENVYFASNFKPNNTDEDYLEFFEKYTSRFDKEPSYAAIFAYESVIVLNEAIKRKGTNIDKLKKEILKISVFDGLQGDFIIDEFGDVKREIYKIKVEDSKYKGLNE